MPYWIWEASLYHSYFQCEPICSMADSIFSTAHVEAALKDGAKIT